jgi:hypothetical protein
MGDVVVARPAENGNPPVTVRPRGSFSAGPISWQPFRPPTKTAVQIENVKSAMLRRIDSASREAARMAGDSTG